MDLFQTWKLAIDALLVISLLYLSVRFLKTNRAINTRELRDLEIVLRTLLRDADVASKSLSDSLSRRQGGLEKLLGDLSGSEVRLRDLSQKAESLKDGLIATVAKAEAYAVREPRAYRAATSERVGTISLSRETEERAPSNQNYSAGEEAQVVEPRASRTANSAKLNIFGEPIEPSSETVVEAAPVYPKQQLAREIEVERAGGLSRAAYSRPKTGMDKIYEAAEAMLRAGKDLESTAAITRLPIEDVRKLSQLVIREQHQQSSRTEQRDILDAQFSEEAPVAQSKSREASPDPRLGVLATMRRQVEVL